MVNMLSSAVTMVDTMIVKITSLFAFLKADTTLFGATLLTSTVVPLLIIKSYRTRLKKKAESSKTVEKITEVLFFTDNFASSNPHDDYSMSCECPDCGTQNLKRIVKYLMDAKSSLDICVFTITNARLGSVILQKKREGLQVRIITDASMCFSDGSQIPMFRKEGIMVRTRPSQNLMHHKFAIIDKKLLMNGSYNWTAQATFGNWENVVLTTVPECLVKRFSDHFEYLWSQLV